MSLFVNSYNNYIRELGKVELNVKNKNSKGEQNVILLKVNPFKGLRLFRY